MAASPSLTKPLSVPCGFQQLAASSIASTAQGLSVPTPVAPTSAAGALPLATWTLIRAETGNVRWRDDDTAPTSTTGFLMTSSDIPLDYFGDLAKIKFISVSSTNNAVVDISFYGGSPFPDGKG